MVDSKLYCHINLIKVKLAGPRHFLSMIVMPGTSLICMAWKTPTGLPSHVRHSVRPRSSKWSQVPFAFPAGLTATNMAKVAILPPHLSASNCREEISEGRCGIDR